jgi:hypothetical protein
MVETEVLVPLRFDKIEGLEAVIEPVELADGWADRRAIVAKRRLRVGCGITVSQKVFPFIEIG